MLNLETLESMLRTLKMYHTAENIDSLIETSRGKSLTNERFLEEFLNEEIKGRESRRLEKRLKQALFPEYKTLLEFNLDEQRSLGIGIEAINSGYKVRFITMADLIHLLKTQEISTGSRNKIKRIIDSDLFIIDDLMFMAMEKQEANLFFQLINKLYGQTSIIITSNKGPEEWGELLGDAAITTAILDRIVHKCEVVNFFDDDSYRIKHRQSIFGSL